MAPFQSFRYGKSWSSDGPLPMISAGFGSFSTFCSAKISLPLFARMFFITRR